MSTESLCRQPIRFLWNEADCKPPFTLTAKLNKLTIKVDRPKLSPADIKKLETAMRNNKASE